MASNWEERLRLKDATRKMTNRFGLRLSQPGNTNKERKTLNYESNDHLQKVYNNGAKLSNYERLASRKEKETNQRCIRALQALYTLRLSWKIQQIRGTMCFTYNNGAQSSAFDNDICGRVAEQLHCSLHVKELKVTTTELEGQAGN